MPFVVGVKTVNLWVGKILRMFVHHGIETTQCIHVNYRKCPDIAGFFHSINIFFQIDAALVRVVFRTLPVLENFKKVICKESLTSFQLATYLSFSKNRQE